MAGNRKGPWCLGIPIALPTKTSGATPQPVPKGKDLGHAFGLTHGYDYGEVTSKNLAFALIVGQSQSIRGGSFVVFPT